MRWKTFKTRIKKNPHLLDPAFRCSLEEAGALLAAEGYPSFREMAAGARKKSDLPDTLWAEVDAFFERRKAKKRRSVRTYAALQPLRFRLIVAGLILFLAVGYFTVIPSGRTSARKLFDIVFVRDEYGDRFVSGNETNVVGPVPFEENIEREYESYAALEADTGLTPSYVEADWLTFRNIEYFRSRYTGVDNIACFFDTADGRFVQIGQEYGDVPTTTIVSSGEYFTEDYGTGREWHCWVSDDGIFTGIAILDRSLLYVYVEGGVAPEDVMDALVIRE